MKRFALVTGGAKRLGRVICILLASLGYGVVIHYHRSKNSALQLQKMLTMHYNVPSFLLQYDLSKFKNLKRLINKARKIAPPCSVLINNASIFNRTPLSSITQPDFILNQAIHVQAPLFLSKYFSNGASTEALIINIIDNKINKDSSNYFCYMLSKKSLFNLTTMLAAEFRAKIRINAICPCAISDFALSINDHTILENDEIIPFAKNFTTLLSNSNLTGQIYMMSDS